MPTYLTKTYQFLLHHLTKRPVFYETCVPLEIAPASSSTVPYRFSGMSKVEVGVKVKDPIRREYRGVYPFINTTYNITACYWCEITT